ncbi:MAG: response regulator [Sterolibacterium sp.]|nr:response regulator [Sterolibacterium sp.]MBP9798551.1 response regulator [Sterolibacterium sp.]
METAVGRETLLNTLSVFLVEPSAVQSKYIAGELGALGVSRIRIFESAQEVLDQMKNEHPGVVISALYLPDMSGTELVYAMRSDPDLADVAFVLISSETRPQVLEPVRQSGACGILPKPFTEVQLKKVLASTLDYLSVDNSLINEHFELEELTVLLVDDSTTSRNYVRHVFENVGLKNFIEAENGLEAARIMEETLVDLVVTDFNMPEMDGGALVEHIRHKSWQNSVPILMITSEQNRSRLAGLGDLGVFAICDKPFEPEIIKPLLARLLEEHH